jgi:hypothetical protein
MVDQALEPLREFLRIDGPIAQAGVVVIARAEPAIMSDYPPASSWIVVILWMKFPPIGLGESPPVGYFFQGTY